jgi:hypothetical protein
MLTSLILSVPGFAHERLALCTTADKKYTITVDEEDSKMHASITQGGRVVASYKAERHRGPTSVSFGRPTFQDINTEGQVFVLQGPSTNMRNYILDARIKVKGYEIRLTDKHLSCSIFVGHH